MDNKLSVCIEMLFTELPFTERIKKVAELGIKGFEFWGWQDKELEKIDKVRKRFDMQLVAFGGSGAPLTDPAQTESAIKDIKKSLKVAEDMGPESLIITVGNEQKDISREIQYKNIIKVLKKVAPLAEATGVTLVIEPLNTLVDHQGYYLNKSKEGYKILNEVDSPGIKLLFDIYHQQITEGNIIENITENINLIGHFHLADVPGRHEPGTGELNYNNIFSAIKKTEYNGFIGCEFKPQSSSEESLKKVKKIGNFR